MFSARILVPGVGGLSALIMQFDISCGLVCGLCVDVPDLLRVLIVRECCMLLRFFCMCCKYHVDFTFILLLLEN